MRTDTSPVTSKSEPPSQRSTLPRNCRKALLLDQRSTCPICSKMAPGPNLSKAPAQTAPWGITALHNPAGSTFQTSLHDVEPLVASTNVCTRLHRFGGAPFTRESSATSRTILQPLMSESVWGRTGLTDVRVLTSSFEYGQGAVRYVPFIHIHTDIQLALGWSSASGSLTQSVSSSTHLRATTS